jgi:hypothetical protein
VKVVVVVLLQGMAKEKDGGSGPCPPSLPPIRTPLLTHEEKEGESEGRRGRRKKG